LFLQKIKKKPVVAPSPLDVLNTNYKSPSPSCITIVDNNMKLSSPVDLDFVMTNKSLKDFFVITAIGPPQSG